MAKTKSKRRRDLEAELALIERVAGWSGHGRRSWSERLSEWAIVSFECLAAIAVGVAVLGTLYTIFLAPEGVRDSLTSVGNGIVIGSIEAITIALALTVLWLVLGNRILRAVRRHYAIGRKLDELDSRLERLPVDDDRGTVSS